MPIQDDFENFQMQFNQNDDERSVEQAYLEDIIWSETQINEDALRNFNFRNPDYNSLYQAITTELKNVPQDRHDFYFDNFTRNKQNHIIPFLLNFAALGPTDQRTRVKVLCNFIARCLSYDLTVSRVALVNIPEEIRKPYHNNWQLELHKIGIF